MYMYLFFTHVIPYKININPSETFCTFVGINFMCLLVYVYFLKFLFFSF